MCTTETIISQFLDYLSKRDLSNLVNLFSDNIQWEVPGDTQKIPWLGKRISKSEVEEFFKVLWEQTEPLSADIDKIFVHQDRKSTRLNSSHVKISYAVFCLKKK